MLHLPGQKPVAMHARNLAHNLAEFGAHGWAERPSAGRAPKACAES